MTFRMWRFRLAVAGRFGYHREVFKVWAAQAKAEGGSAAFNPWNSTTYWQGSTAYNSFGPNGEYHVWNYPNARAGILATLATIHNGNYPGLYHDYRTPGRLTARQIVERNAAELGKWGTGSENVLRNL